MPLAGGKRSATTDGWTMERGAKGAFTTGQSPSTPTILRSKRLSATGKKQEFPRPSPWDWNRFTYYLLVLAFHLRFLQSNSTATPSLQLEH